MMSNMKNISFITINLEKGSTVENRDVRFKTESGKSLTKMSLEFEYEM